MRIDVDTAKKNISSPLGDQITFVPIICLFEVIFYISALL